MQYLGPACSFASCQLRVGRSVFAGRLCVAKCGCDFITQIWGPLKCGAALKWDSGFIMLKLGQMKIIVCYFATVASQSNAHSELANQADDHVSVHE